MGLITLTSEELMRVQVAQRVLDGSLSLAGAALSLGLSTRQVKRLTRRLREQGAAAFSSPKRSRPPNNAFDPAIRERVLELFRTIYAGFGPTLLAEKLLEREQISINRETLRQWLIEAKMHRPRRRRQKPRPLRERRPRFGELVQADGSPHPWFDDRRATCTLLLCVDDATTRVLGGLFAEHETTNDYFQLFEQVFGEHGLPEALYTDRHGIFRINHAGAKMHQETHVQRALRELDIQLICANSPQAKGRVERTNRSLQDRLVKELRLRGISTIPEANRFLPSFFEAFNNRFSVAPSEPQDAHRPSTGVSLATILTKHYERVLTNNLTFQIDDKIYAIDPSPLHRLRGKARITVSVTRDDKPFVWYKGSTIATRFVGKRQRTGTVVDSKQLNAHVEKPPPAPKKGRVPAKTHPWRRPYDPIAVARAQAAKGHS
jgi:transposase